MSWSLRQTRRGSDRCGVVFVNTDDSGNITSINVKHSMFPDVDMVAFPRRDEDPVIE